MSAIDKKLERPSTRAILKELYWTLRKDRATTVHIMKAIGRSVVLVIILKQRRVRINQRLMVAVALVEHMGDIVAAEPLARLARATFPRAQIAWLTRKPYRSLPDAYAAVDDTIVVQCMTEWLLAWSYGVFDVVWDLHLSGRSCPVCNAAFRKPGAPGKITHETYYDLGNLLETQSMVAGLKTPADGPVLRSTPATARSVANLKLPASFVVIHAKSNDAQRDWNDLKWAKLVDHLYQTFDGYIIEIGIVSCVIRSDGDRQRNLCGRLSILETAELIRRAKLFIGVDSGPAHLANAVGTSGVILLGDYNAFRNQMPYSGFYATQAGATILRADGPVGDLAEDAVIRAIDARLRSEPSPAAE